MLEPNSRYKTRLFKSLETHALLSAGVYCLNKEKPDIEIPTLIMQELECRLKEKNNEAQQALEVIKQSFLEKDIRPIKWLQRARKQLQLLQNPPNQTYNSSHSVYVILMDYFKEDKTYGVYVGETYLLPEERFKNHLSGISASPKVKKRGLQLLRSLMPYSPKKITDRQSSIFESAVHLCLEKTKTTLGKNPKFLRVRGNGNNIKPEDWPKGFQRNLRAELNTED